MGLYGFGAALGVIIVMAAVSFLLRYVNDSLSLKRLRKADAVGRDTIIASLRPRLPAGAEMVRIEHQMYFFDERNRAAAADVFLKNGFETRTSETYEGRTKYWLLATRSAMLNGVPEEFARVYEFAKSYGGRYSNWNPQL